MSATTQSEGGIDVELPSHWEDEVDEEIRDEIHEVTQRVDNAFREEGFETDLESVRVKDTNKKPAVYHPREKDNSGEIPNQAEISIDSDNSNRDFVNNSAQDFSYTHELGHDFFLTTVARGCGNEIRDEIFEIYKESASVYWTLNEAFADLTALKYSNADSRSVERNPFRETHKKAFQGLEETFNLDNRKEELRELEEIKNDIEKGDYESAKNRIDYIQDITPDVDFNKNGRIGTSRRNIFLLGMEDFFSTERNSTSINEDKIETYLNDLIENPENGVTKVTHGPYDGREIRDKAEELCNNVGKESEVRNKSEDILEDLTRDWIKPTINQVQDQVKRVKSEDLGSYTFERLEYEQYGSSSRTDEDVDFPHEVGGVLAEVLYENNIDPTDIVENPIEYAEMTREVIEETIEYGVEVASGEAEQEWGEPVTEEYKEIIEGVIS